MEARPQTGWSQKQKANALKFSFPRGGGVFFFFCVYENERGGSLHLFAFSTFVLRSRFGDFREAFSKQSSVGREEASGSGIVVYT